MEEGRFGEEEVEKERSEEEKKEEEVEVRSSEMHPVRQE